MKEISKFQIIRVAKDRVVVRCYNEEKDRFEKLHSAEEVFYCSNLLIVGDHYFYDYHNRLSFVGCRSDFVTVLRDYFTECKIYALPVKDDTVPFKALLLDGDSYGVNVTPVLSYEQKNGDLYATLLDGKTVKISFSHEYDDMGNIKLTRVAMS